MDGQSIKWRITKLLGAMSKKNREAVHPRMPTRFCVQKHKPTSVDAILSVLL